MTVLRTFGPPMLPPVSIPNEEALYLLMESVPVTRFRLGETGKRSIRDVFRTLARELSRRGVRAPGSA